MDYTAILILACVFIPLERLVPLHPEQGLFRRGWYNDLFYLLFNGIVVRAGSAVVLGAVMAAYRHYVPSDANQWLRAFPLWAQVIGVAVVADIGYYTAHRMSHSIPFLWKFHAVHHSIEEMDWLASHRVHPFDQIFTNSLSLLPVFFLGFSAPAVIISLAIFQAHALLLHSNVRLKFGPLKWLIASPEYHHWHHADQREAYDRNFAAQISLIDLVAGTIFLPEHRPQRYGVSEPVPRLYPQQFLYPFHAILKLWRSRQPSREIGLEQDI